MVVDNKGLVADVCMHVATWIQEAGLIHFLYRSAREDALKVMLEEAIKLSGRRVSLHPSTGNPEMLKPANLALIQLCLRDLKLA